jgi:hypothetical protein
MGIVQLFSGCILYCIRNNYVVVPYFIYNAVWFELFQPPAVEGLKDAADGAVTAAEMLPGMTTMKPCKKLQHAS